VIRAEGATARGDMGARKVRKFLRYYNIPGLGHVLAD